MNTIGSYVWYKRKNAIVKVLEYDIQSNSYTIEYKGRVIDTIDKFIDKNIGTKCMTLFNQNVELKGLVDDLKSEILAMKTNTTKEKEDRDYEKHEISEYMKSMELDRIRLESDIKSLTERMTEYRGLYEKSVKSLIVKGCDKTTETIIFNNFIKEKTDEFLWKDLNNQASETLDLYKDFESLKLWLCKNYHNPSPLVSKEIDNWFLQKNEYIVGVYYSNNEFGLDSSSHAIQYPVFISKQSPGTAGKTGGVINEIIFYTNYGNVTSVKYYNNNGFIDSGEILKFRLDKILTNRMINVINKSISSGLRERGYICSYKSSNELYEFICDVAEI